LVTLKLRAYWTDSLTWNDHIKVAGERVGVNCIQLAQDSFQWKFIYQQSNETSDSIKAEIFLATQKAGDIHLTL
jgi:hypothetical protein